MALTFPIWGLHPHTLPMGPGFHISTDRDFLSLPELHCRCICVQLSHSSAWPQTDFSAWPWTCPIIVNLPGDMRQVGNKSWTQLPPLDLPCLPLLGTAGLDSGWWGPCPASCVTTAGAAGPCSALMPTLQLMTCRSHLSKGDTVSFDSHNS